MIPFLPKPSLKNHPRVSILPGCRLGLLLGVFLLLFITGCATQTQQLKMNEGQEQFKNGNLQNTSATIESAFKTKNTLYYLEMGEVQRLSGPSQIPSSTKNLLVADEQVNRWEIQNSERLKRSFGDVGSYVLSEGLSDDYDPKFYEVSLLSQTLALNHIAQGHWSDAMVEGKKMAQREKVIEELIQGKVAAVSKAEESQQLNQNTRGASSRIESISGYPVNLLDDEETRSLKNSYQNPSAYYLSAFIHESQGETSLAAPGYRLALELQPSVSFFKSGLAKLDANVKNRNAKASADTLILIDTGYLPKITPYKLNQSFYFGGSFKIVTLTFPVIEKSNERFTPNNIQVGAKIISPELVTNIDAMARKNLKDEMPGYVLRATSRALVSIGAQMAADRAAQQATNKNNNNGNNNSALIGAITGAITGMAMQSINVTDTRHWSTLPSQTYMARVDLPVGENVLKYATPSGMIRSQTVKLLAGYNVIYIRMFRDRASVIVSNDPNALPQQTPIIVGSSDAKIDPKTKSSGALLQAASSIEKSDSAEVLKSADPSPAGIQVKGDSGVKGATTAVQYEPQPGVFDLLKQLF